MGEIANVVGFPGSIFFSAISVTVWPLASLRVVSAPCLSRISMHSGCLIKKAQCVRTALLMEEWYICFTGFA